MIFMADYDNEQDFTGAVIAKTKQLFESKTARIVMAAVLAIIVIIILAAVMLSGRSGEEFENPDPSPQAVRNENDVSSETAPESEEITENMTALKYQMTKVSSESPVFSMINNAANPYKLSVEIAAAGNAESNLRAAESGYSAFIENESIQGTIVELAYTDGLEVEKVKLMFEIKESALENTSADTSDEFEGIKRFNVFMFDEELNMQLPIETKFDLENNIVYAETDRCGTYSLVDMEIWVDMIAGS